MLDDLLRNDPTLTKQVEKALIIFTRNPSDSRLRNHKLTRYMEGKWSISIDEDIRIVYKWIGKNTVHLLAVGPGPHEVVYKKYK